MFAFDWAFIAKLLPLYSLLSHKHKDKLEIIVYNHLQFYGLSYLILFL